ncbi:hypothetical protein [Campylobacter mucosalis]|uniref:hypothetical protein n=1 Tax=Campylobacter mucosalis TaxID=202 RepID=UPI000ACDAD68|nr:hypothetical protein [Campylobacter mucosalis]
MVSTCIVAWLFAYGALTDEKGDFEFFIVMLCIWGVISVGVTIAQRKQIETLENQIDSMRKELDELRSKTIQGKVTNAIADTAIGVMKDAVTDVLFR